jgi:hypothetical protein
MRLLRTLVLAAATLSAATAKKKKRRRKVDARTEQQRLCDACMGLAEHARTVVNVAIKDVSGAVVDWPAVLNEGCPAPECSTLLKGVSAAIAEELHMLVEDGDAIDARVLPDLLCAPASVTGACHHYDPPDATPRTKLVVALHNERQGSIEVHLVAPSDMDKDCAPSEDIRNETKRLALTNVRTLRADEEQLFVLSIHALSPTLPTLRAKPLGAPCGAGADLNVDLLEDRWAVYYVRDPPPSKVKLPGGIFRPLVLGRIDGRDARDMLPNGHPFHGEL